MSVFLVDSEAKLQTKVTNVNCNQSGQNQVKVTGWHLQAREMPLPEQSEQKQQDHGKRGRGADQSLILGDSLSMHPSPLVRVSVLWGQIPDTHRT